MPTLGGLAVSLAEIFFGPLSNLMRRRRLARRSSAGRSPAKRSPKRRVLFEPLESRVLLSADLVPGAELFVVDGSIEDYEARFDVPALYLDAGSDGIGQITEALRERPGVSAVHILSHGASGSIQLGSTTLDAESLASREAELRAWGEALGADADLLIYGCEVGAGDAGAWLLGELGRLTGADVAGSTDLTGSASLGGDWELEFATGAIEATAIGADQVEGTLILASVLYDGPSGILQFLADAGQTDSVTVTSPADDQLRIVVGNGDTIDLPGGSISGFTLDVTGTQLDIDTTAAPISAFALVLGDGDDAVSLTNNTGNGLGAVAILGDLGSDTVTLGQTSLGGELTLSVETVVIGGNIDVGSHAITAPGAVSFSGSRTVTAGTLDVGSLGIGGGVTATLDADTTAASLSLAGTLDGTGNVALTGAGSWTSGTLGGAGDLTIAAGATLSMVSSTHTVNGKDVVNHGTVNWTGGQLQLDGASTFVNNGTFQLNGNVTALNSGSGSMTFTNAALGTMRNLGGTNILGAGLTVHNQGAVQVNAGVLDFAGGGGTHTGSFATAAGTTLDFSAGIHDLDNAAAISSLGTLLISGATVNTTGTLTAGGLLRMTSGTFNPGGTVNAAAYQQTNGTLNVNGTLNAVTYSQSGGVLAGAGTVTATGLMSWTAGTMTGTGITNANGGLRLTGFGVKDLTGGRTLNNTGAAIWSNALGDNTGRIRTGGGATINNSGTWSDEGPFNNQISNDFGGAASTFNNTGTYSKSSPGLTNIQIGFNNTSSGPGTGIVEIMEGTLDLGGAGESNGTFTGAAGTTLQFSGGTYDLTAASRIEAANVHFSAGTVNVAGSYAATETTIVNGTGIAGFTGTVLNTSGALSVGSSGTLRVQNGTLSISGELAQTGTIEVAGGATLRKTGGFLNDGGILSGNGTIDVGIGGTLTSSGTIRPGSSPGLLHVIGDLTLIAGSVMEFELAGETPGSQHDAMDVSGSVTLGGDADILHFGGFTPAADDVFRVIEAGGTVGGTFTNVNSPAGFTYEAVYQADHVTFQLEGNEPPDAVNDSYTTDEDTPLVVAGPGVLGNDADPDLDPLTAAPGAGPEHGTLTLNGDGSFTYTPDANYFGSDTFTYRASDGLLESDLATVELTIAPVADAPVAVDDSATTDEDGAVVIDARGNDTDADFNVLTITSVDQGANGSVVINPDGTLTYTPDADFHGIDSFEYAISDGALADTGLVLVTVNPVNDAPELAAIGDQAVNEGETLAFVAAATDADLTANGLVFSLDAGAPAGATIDATTGAFSWTPTEEQGPGSYAITVRVTDDGSPALSDFETITISVSDVGGDAADLAGTVGWDPADVLIPGDDEQATVLVQNTGSVAIGDAVQVTLYASADATLDASDMVLAIGHTSGGLAAGEAEAVHFCFDLTASLLPREYFLLAQVDSAGQVAESDETNNVSAGAAFDFSWMFGAVPDHGRVTLVVPDADGTLVRFSLLGPGTGEITIDDAGEWDVLITGTNAISVVTVLTLGGGDHRVALDDIHVAGALGALIAPTTDLTGTLAIDRAVTGGIVIGSATHAVITVPDIIGFGFFGLAVQGIAILGDLEDSQISIGDDLGHLLVAGSMVSSSVTAEHGGIRSVTILGGVSADCSFTAEDLPRYARIEGALLATMDDPRFTETGEDWLAHWHGAKGCSPFAAIVGGRGFAEFVRLLPRDRLPR